jgi:hypothetical protein
MMVANGSWPHERCRHVKTQTNWLAAVSRIVIGAGLSLTNAQTGQAHDWYPIECCHGMDCAPVEKIETLAPLSAVRLPRWSSLQDMGLS